MDIKGILTHKEFYNRESMMSHLSYEREMEFYQSIKMGNADEVHRLFKPLESEGLGKLSDDPIRNLQYHLVITIAFITRYCIEGGMEHELAYNLSDIYINRLDKCRTRAEIDSLHRELVDDYVQKMQTIHKGSFYSKPVLICLEYIYNNLHSRIRLEDLADITNFSPTYISKLFHKEVGETVSEYIVKKRIEAAENLLRFSDYSCTDISNYLCFSSESHFISVFKKYTKTTPKEYRKKYFRSHWGEGNGNNKS